MPRRRLSNGNGLANDAFGVTNPMIWRSRRSPVYPVA